MKLLLIPIVIAFAVLPGCGLFRNACDKAIPVLVAGNSYAGDAEQAIAQLERAIANMPADKLKDLLPAIEKARASLRAAQSTLAAASSACSAVDMDTAFGAFVAAWDAVKSIVSVVALFKPMGAAGSLGASASALPFPDPAIYLKIKGR